MQCAITLHFNREIISEKVYYLKQDDYVVITYCVLLLIPLGIWVDASGFSEVATTKRPVEVFLPCHKKISIEV